MKFESLAKNPPKISIIIPTYNRGYILPRTLESIQQQTWSDWEVHLVDDGSIDNTAHIIQPFLKDPRIYYHIQKNQGPAVARNLGMSKAVGELITFIDSDDPVYPYYLESGLEYFSQNPRKTFALSHCDFFYELYGSDGVLLSRKIAEKSLNLHVTLQEIYDWKVHVAIGTGLFLKSNFFRERVSWNPNIIPGDDIEFVMQLACLDPDGFGYISHALFEYQQRYGGDGMCSKTSYGGWADMFEKIYALHQKDLLMKEPEQYLNRIEKYRRLQQQYEKGEIVPPELKYFPEFWQK
jgi:glycosyltransferase involved in cell wall biosynthesis